MANPITYERVLSGSNLFLSIAVLAVGGMIWNAVNVHDHSYRLDKLEQSQTAGRAEVLTAISNVAADVKGLTATFADMKAEQKTEKLLQQQADANRDAQIKVILDRMEKR